MMDDLLRQILTSRVYDVARETPLDGAERLSARVGNTVLLKREDLQPIFSFKLRGAYNRIRAPIRQRAGAPGDLRIGREPRARRGLCGEASRHCVRDRDAAHHAGDQGRRRSSARWERSCSKAMTILPRVPTAMRIAPSTGAVFVHPFDDPLVIAGQGTIGDEIVRQSHSRLHAVFVPVGGGGLIAGIASYIKAVMPDVRVVGVEPFESDAMYQSLQAGRRVTLDRVGIFVDGVSVRTVGERTFELAQRNVDEVIRVSNDAVCAAIREIFEDTRSVMEPGLARWRWPGCEPTWSERGFAGSAWPPFSAGRT